MIDITVRPSYSRESSQPREKFREKDRALRHKHKLEELGKTLKDDEETSSDQKEAKNSFGDAEISKNASVGDAEISKNASVGDAEISKNASVGDVEISKNASIGDAEISKNASAEGARLMIGIKDPVECSESLLQSSSSVGAEYAASQSRTAESYGILQEGDIIVSTCNDTILPPSSSSHSTQMTSPSAKNPLHVPLHRTTSVSGRGYSDGYSDAVRKTGIFTGYSDAVRKSASTDDCTPAYSDRVAEGKKVRHYSAAALEHVRLQHNSGIDSTGSGSKSRHNSGGVCFNSCCYMGGGASISAVPGGPVSDVSSAVESGQNTDIGCEGDVSESDDCADWLREFETAQPCLPKFWLIMEVTERHVDIFFHCRLPNDLCMYEKVHTETVHLVQALVLHVNQSLLLQHLYSTRMCHRLLTRPEEVEDGAACNFSVTTADDEVEDCFNTAELDATMRYDGKFACCEVLEHKFALHPKLKTLTGNNTGVSKGLLALRSALGMISVNNRSNMFVYQDNSCSSKDNIFYLKLHEMFTSHSSKRLQPSGSVSSTGTMLTNLNNTIISGGAITRLPDASNAGVPTDFSSVIDSSFPPTSRPPHLKDDEGSESLHNYCSRDAVTESTASAISQSSSSRSLDVIQLTAYGIAEPGPSIKQEMVEMLQKKLDETVLECICLLLWSNTHHKLPPEDVHFIQIPHQPPFLSLRLQINVFDKSHVPAFFYYLKQNMTASGFNRPKYSDPSPRNRFRDYTLPDSSNTDEEYVFLHVCSHRGPSKNIACIIISLEDGSEESSGESDASADMLLCQQQFKRLTHATRMPLSDNESAQGKSYYVKC